MQAALGRRSISVGDHVIRKLAPLRKRQSLLQVLYKSKLAALQNLNKADERQN